MPTSTALWLCLMCAAAAAKDVAAAAAKDDGWVELPVVKTSGQPKGCMKHSGHGDMVMLKVSGRQVPSGQAVRIKGMDADEPLVLRIGRKSHGQVWDTVGDAACEGEQRTITVPARETKPSVVWDVKVLRITKANDPAADMVNLWDSAEKNGDQRLSPEEIVAHMDKEHAAGKGELSHKKNPEAYRKGKVAFVRNLLKRDTNHDRVLSWGELSDPDNVNKGHDGEL